MSKATCPECGYKMNDQGKVTLRITACDIEYFIETPAIVCLCGLAMHELDNLETAELAVADQLLKRDRMDGDVLRWCRKSLGMTRSELASLLHSTEESICAFEAGLEPVPAGARTALREHVAATRASRSWTPVVTTV